MISARCLLLLVRRDEFTLPFATSAFGRLIWVLMVLGGVLLVANFAVEGDCKEIGYVALSYELVSFFVAVVSMFLDYRIAVVSTYGTIIGLSGFAVLA